MDYVPYALMIILALLVYFKNYLRSVYLAFSLSGPSALPVLGNVLLVKNSENMVEIGITAHQSYGPFMRFWLSILPIIFIYEPKHLRIVLGNNKLTRKNIFYKILHNFIGEGLITNNGYKWKKNRKLIQPHFHINMLEHFIEIFTESAINLATKLDGKLNVNVTSYINDCVLEILSRAVLGIELDEDSPYRKGEVILTERITKPWLLFDAIFKRTPFAEKQMKQKMNLHNYTKQILLKRQQESKQQPSKNCLLDSLIEIKKVNIDFTDEDIINEAVTFMLAGQDSVAATIAFTLFFLAKHQEVQNKVMSEIDDIDISQTKLTLEDLNRMKYLEQVIKESLRLIPTVPILARILREDVILDDVVFPAGTNIFVSPFITHRLPHIYPEPLTFDPDRFSEGNLTKLHPYAFIPFSIGSRTCIGYKFALLEIKTIIFTILKKYEVNLSHGFENYKLSYRTTIRAKGGIWLQLTRRK